MEERKVKKVRLKLGDNIVEPGEEDRETKLKRLALERANRIAKGKQERDAPDENEDIEQTLNDSLASANAAWEQSKKARAEKIPSIRAVVEHTSKRPTHENMRFSNILPIIDAIETKIIDTLKKSGYTKIEKTDEARRFSKSKTEYFDVYKNGEMRGNSYDLSGDEKAIIDGVVASTFAMIDVYLEVATKYGNDLAFPTGSINAKAELSPNAVTLENKAKVDHISEMIQIKLEDALKGKKYDGIRSHVLLEGKAIVPDSPMMRARKEAYPPTDDPNKRQVIDRSMLKEAFYNHRMGK